MFFNPFFSDVAVLGVTERTEKEGRIGVYGDSNCIDSAHMKRDCFWMLQSLLEMVTTDKETIALEEWKPESVHTGNSPHRMVGGHLYK